MYCVMMDVETKTYYMKPREIKFYAFSSPSKRSMEPNSKSVLVETELTDKKELTTGLFNAGFDEGFLDGNHIHIGKADAHFIDRNKNEICFGQFILTNDEKYLQSIEKKKLYSLCKITEDGANFPTITDENGELAVLCYTDRQRIPQILFDKYSDGYRVVRMSFAVPVFVNSKFYLD